jgi:hypothetical protein
MTWIRPRSKFALTRRRIAAPPLLIRGWVMLSIWMQTTGAPLLAVNQCSMACVQTLAQDSRSVHGLLYGPIGASKNTVREQLTLIPTFVRHCQSVGCCRSPGNSTFPVTEVISAK